MAKDPLEEMEERIAKIYSTAEDEISQKWDIFMRKANARVASYQEAYDAALKLGDSEAIDKAKEALERAIRNQTLGNAHYAAMVRQTADRLTDTNIIAQNYVNGKMATCYTIAFNDTSNDISDTIQGYSFELVDESTIRELAKDPDILRLPYKEIDETKDVRWNTKNINSQLTQGILQGESIPKIATRLQNVTNMNRNAAIRNARTMNTSARNLGNLDSMREAAENGVLIKKTWLTVDDDRTRASHSALNEETIDLDEKFSNGLMFPGDSKGDPCEVYNCRCTMVSEIYGFQRNGKINFIDEESERAYNESVVTTENNTNRVGQDNKVYDVYNEKGQREAIESIRDYSGLGTEDSEKVAEALFGYNSDRDYCYFMGADTDIRNRDNDKASEYADNIQMYIDSAPKYNGTIYRGLGISDDVLSNLSVGTQLDESQYSISSWTSNKHVGVRFANMATKDMNKVILECDNSLHGTPVRHLSLYPDEDEVLVNNKNTKYEITEIITEKTARNTYTRIILKEI